MRSLQGTACTGRRQLHICHARMRRPPGAVSCLHTALGDLQPAATCSPAAAEDCLNIAAGSLMHRNRPGFERMVEASVQNGATYEGGLHGWHGWGWLADGWMTE